MTKLAAILNMKGGVGKTTLTFNLCSYLSEIEHQRVLLIDLDPQANATIVSTSEEKYKEHCKEKKTIADVFINAHRVYGPIHSDCTPTFNIKDYIYNVYTEKQGRGRFDLIPSELMLSSILKGMTLGPYDLDKLITPEVKLRYDYILLDCAPTNSSLTTIALNTAKAVLIPMIADAFGLYGTKLMKQVLDEHKYDFDVDVKVIGVVFTMWEKQADPLTHSNKIIKGWDAEQIFNAKIKKNNWYRVANGKRTAVWKTTGGDAIYEEFEKFVEEFKERL